jgi:hypothetical protein
MKKESAMFSRRRLMAASVAVSLGLGLAGSPASAASQSFRTLPVVAPAASSAASSPMLAAEVSAADRLLAARAAASGVSSYRMRGAADSARQGRIGILVEHVAPDRSHLAMHAEPDPTNPAAAGSMVEVIVIGATAYLNFGEGWTKIDGDPSAAAATSSYDLRAMLDAIDPASVTVVGSVELAGEWCDLLSTVRDGETLTLWIARGDDGVRKIEGIGADARTDLIVTDLNTPIEINAPI